MDFFEPTGYGRFDPAAFGMWLNVDKALQHPAYAELGPLMWTTFHFPLDEKHRAYVRAAGSGEDAIFAATCFTVATHERRHFHDLLATPYGSVLARQYLRAAFFYGVLNEEILLRRDKIAVPLDEWCLNARLFKSSFGIDPPSENIVHINGIFKTMLDKLVAFDHGRINPGRLPEYPTAASILEGLAVMVQLRQIGEEFGLSYGEGFGRSVLQGVGADRYFGALQLIARMLGQQLPIAAEALLLQASLYGNFQDTDPNRPQYPIDLLASLLAWMSERGVFRLQRPLRQEAYLPYVVEAMDEYFRERQGGSLQDMVRQATVANRGVLEALRKDLASFEQATGRSNPFCKCVLDVFQDFIAVQESFSTRVVNDLAWYTSYEYVRDQFGLFRF